MAALCLALVADMIPTWIQISSNDERFCTEVIRVMKHNHSGQSSASKPEHLMREIFDITPKHPGYANQSRILRRTFEVINQDYNGMIVSDTEVGYWWAESLKDGLEAVDKNRARARTILANAHQVESNILSAYGGQMGLI